MNLDMCSEIEIFYMVLKRKLSKYPTGFWSPPDGIIYAINILKYLIENILEWGYEDIIKNFSAKVFIEYRLNGMLSCVFNSSPFEAINAVYPNKFKVWQFTVPRGYWENDENVINAVKFVYEEQIGISESDDLYKISNHKEVFAKYGIGCIPKAQNKTIHEVIFMAYPGLSEDGFIRRSSSAYTIENQIEELRNIIKNKKLMHEDIVKMTAESLKEYNLYAFLVVKCKMDIYEIMELAFPNEYKPWEFPKIKSGFWKDKKNIQEAVKWLIQKRLHLNPYETIIISKEDFYNNGLGSLVSYVDLNHIGIKNLVRLVYKDCEIKFKKTNH